MATDIYTNTLFNDGEGLDFADLNKVARIGLTRAADQMYARLAGFLAADGDPDMATAGGADPALTSLAYTLTGGDCALNEGTTIVKVAVMPGTIFQRVAAADGLEAQFLPYTIEAGDVDLTIGAGHATLNRVDIVQMKLEWESGGAESRDFKDASTGEVTTTTPNKTRRVKATFSLKAGTAATPPTYPAPDAGYCVIGAVTVPATWTNGVRPEVGSAGFAVTRQMSVPLGITSVTMTPNEFDYTWASGWRRADAADGASLNGLAYADGAGTQLTVWCPLAGQTRRIVGVDVVGIWVTSGVVLLRSSFWNASGYTTLDALAANQVSCNLSSQLVATGGVVTSKFAHLGDIADASNVTNPSTAAGPVGDPFWSVGGASGPAGRKIQRNGANLAASSWFSRAHLDIDGGSGSKVIAVTWYLAG